MSISDCLLFLLSIAVMIVRFFAVIIAFFVFEFWPVWLLIAALKIASWLIALGVL